ncbi:hypothetical protein BG011_004459 [Mortierella polycephala]|uniref:DUF7492 domain-containing protein n=1 Tax=Mortierella polycephala TaxID=41804 RepID=A0A9P6Q1K2_9FUNG|nr:hypothetical protein BG011_004459 [Mortierella polycephala]
MAPYSHSRATLLKPFLLAVLLVAILLAAQDKVVHSHSWLDCSNTLPSGQCVGFPIGYPSRANPDINTLYTYLISGRPKNAPVCQPGRQDVFPPKNQPKQFPSAKVYAGQALDLTWQANGHMDFIDPANKAAPRTRVGVYWTGKPNKVLRTRKQLTKMTLLRSMDFATSANCDDPANPNTVCHGKITIPKGTKPGKYQLVWWWRFDKNPVGEEYTTCFEVNVQAPKAKSKN